jgi:hypothetical protein
MTNSTTTPSNINSGRDILSGVFICGWSLMLMAARISPTRAHEPTFRRVPWIGTSRSGARLMRHD